MNKTKPIPRCVEKYIDSKSETASKDLRTAKKLVNELNCSEHYDERRNYNLLLVVRHSYTNLNLANTSIINFKKLYHSCHRRILFYFVSTDFQLMRTDETNFEVTKHSCDIVKISQIEEY